MKRTLVRYKTKADRTNERLVKQVFQELHAKAPEGVRYMALGLGDSTFVHFIESKTPDGANPIPELDAFRSFQSGIKERCLEPPQSNNVTIVGKYRMLAE